MRYLPLESQVSVLESKLELKAKTVQQYLQQNSCQYVQVNEVTLRMIDLGLKLEDLLQWKIIIFKGCSIKFQTIVHDILERIGGKPRLSTPRILMFQNFCNERYIEGITQSRPCARPLNILTHMVSKKVEQIIYQFSVGGQESHSGMKFVCELMIRGMYLWKGDNGVWYTGSNILESDNAQIIIQSDHLEYFREVERVLVEPIVPLHKKYSDKFIITGWNSPRCCEIIGAGCDHNNE